MDGLIIKPYWIEKMFKNGKNIEVRSKNTKKRGRIAIIESGSGLIVGDTFLYDTFLMDEKSFNYNKMRHKVGNTFYKKNWAWCITSTFKYPEPIKYKHPQGAVIWVNNVLDYKIKD